MLYLEHYLDILSHACAVLVEETNPDGQRAAQIILDAAFRELLREKIPAESHGQAITSLSTDGTTVALNRSDGSYTIVPSAEPEKECRFVPPSGIYESSGDSSERPDIRGSMYRHDQMNDEEEVADMTDADVPEDMQRQSEAAWQTPSADGGSEPDEDREEEMPAKKAWDPSPSDSPQEPSDMEEPEEPDSPETDSWENEDPGEPPATDDPGEPPISEEAEEPSGPDNQDYSSYEPARPDPAEPEAQPQEGPYRTIKSDHADSFEPEQDSSDTASVKQSARAEAESPVSDRPDVSGKITGHERPVTQEVRQLVTDAQCARLDEAIADIVTWVGIGKKPDPTQKPDAAFRMMPLFWPPRAEDHDTDIPIVACVSENGKLKMKVTQAGDPLVLSIKGTLIQFHFRVDETGKLYCTTGFEPPASDQPEIFCRIKPQIQNGPKGHLILQYGEISLHALAIKHQNLPSGLAHCGWVLLRNGQVESAFLSPKDGRYTRFIIENTQYEIRSSWKDQVLYARLNRIAAVREGQM